MEISEKWFSKKIGCSIACNYRCCNSPSFHIEFEDDEIKYLSKKYKRNIKPIEYQNGRCKYLKENSQGCSFGDDKPKYCKKFPLTQNKNNNRVYTQLKILTRSISILCIISLIYIHIKIYLL